MKLTNTTKWALLIGSVILAICLAYSGYFKLFINSFGHLKIIGVFITGIFFGYAFTVAPASIVLMQFTNYYNPLIISSIGALGTMIGDLLIFNVIKNHLPKELENLAKKSKIRKFKKTKLGWLIPVIAGFIIASPLPDEIGISLLGIAKYETKKFMVLSFALNFIGILILTTIAWLV